MRHIPSKNRPKLYEGKDLRCVAYVACRIAKNFRNASSRTSVRRSAHSASTWRRPTAAGSDERARPVYPPAAPKSGDARPWESRCRWRVTAAIDGASNCRRWVAPRRVGCCGTLQRWWPPSADKSRILGATVRLVRQFDAGYPLRTAGEPAVAPGEFDELRTCPL